MKKQDNIFLRLLAGGFLVTASAFVLVPVLWMISASFTKGKLLEYVPLLPDPSKFTLDQYKFIFSYRSYTEATIPDYPAAFGRTLTIAIATMIGVVVVTTLVGYVIARFRFQGKKQIVLGMMLLQMFPSFMGMIAIFLMFRNFGLLNKPLALVLIYVTGAIPYNTFVIRGYLRNVPREIDEAAAIDGASKYQIFTKIILPLSMPIIGFVSVTAFMSPWMDYMLPYILLQNTNRTVAMWLFATTDKLNTLMYNPLAFMAGALLIAVPIMMVNLYFQKYIIYGMTAGSVKG
jgi:arabinogalactan oligomer / maltooligosaccharide transport system permease protein